MKLLKLLLRLFFYFSIQFLLFVLCRLLIHSLLSLSTKKLLLLFIKIKVGLLKQKQLSRIKEELIPKVTPKANEKLNPFVTNFYFFKMGANVLLLFTSVVLLNTNGSP